VKFEATFDSSIMREIQSSPIFRIMRRERARGVQIWERIIRLFFGGNAFVAVVVLAMIMVFLVREGAGFFRQNQANLLIYRQAGLELVEPLRLQERAHAALARDLFDFRIRFAEHLSRRDALSREEVNAYLEPLDDYIYRFGDAIDPLASVVMDLSDMASSIKMRALEAAYRSADVDAVSEDGRAPAAFDFAAARQPLLAFLPSYHRINEVVGDQLLQLSNTTPQKWPSRELTTDFEQWQRAVQDYVERFPRIEATLAAWDPDRPVPMLKAWSTFLTGSQWLTASFWQDWYGVLPLLIGSMMVSSIALVVAIPLGVGAAVYVNQMGSRREKTVIKPAIEFIAAIPSVVLGFFGIIVLGELIRSISQWGGVDWIPGFPIVERLNALTAGLMLAMVAIPTIFTLAEEALENVPRAYREAAYALGATRLQTVRKVVLPTAISGIVSAVLLGFGRVIGETMIVLLCAGNRIAIPDFTQGLEVFTQPVHTMTGIIAQEMGEVVDGGIHYRALFMVGLLLFVITLLINYFAQRAVKRFRVNLG